MILHFLKYIIHTVLHFWENGSICDLKIAQNIMSADKVRVKKRNYACDNTIVTISKVR